MKSENEELLEESITLVGLMKGAAPDKKKLMCKLTKCSAKACYNIYSKSRWADPTYYCYRWFEIGGFKIILLLGGPQ